MVIIVQLMSAHSTVILCLNHSIVENGQEKVEVEEDGQLKSLTVNGKDQLLRLDKWSLNSTDEQFKTF